VGNPQARSSRIRRTSDPPTMTPVPRSWRRLLTIGKTFRRMGRHQAGGDVPIPGVPRYRDRHAQRQIHARASWKNGASTYDFAYSDYKDWNNPLNPARRFTPQDDEKKTARRRDITTTVTETAQMYVTVRCRQASSGDQSTNQRPTGR